MKIKLRRFTAVLSAMLCMICCVLSAIPAFADDTEQGGLTQDVGIIHAVSYMKQQIIAKGGTLDNKNYMAVWYYPNDYGINVKLISFPDNSISLIDGKYSFEHYTPEIFCDVDKWDYTSWDDYDRYTISISQSTSVQFDGNQEFYINEISSKYSWHIIDTNMKITNNGEDVTPTDPNAPVVPFSVQYSPTLCKDMSNKVYYPSKGGANADSSGLVEDENYNLSVKVKLTDDFLKKTAVQNGYLEYSYQYTLFIVPSQFKDSDIKTMSDKAIYTAVNKSQFLYTGNERLDIDHSQTSEPATDVDTSKDVDNQWANANGITNCYYIPRDGSKSSTSTVNIDLHTVNWAKYDYDSYNIVVLSHVIRKTEYGWTAYPYYFTSECEDLSKESKKEYPIKANADDPTKYDNVELYDYYTVVSDDFSLKDIPEYVQQTCDGTTIDQNSPLDFKNKADTVQDYELWKNGEKKNQEDFDDYKKQKQQAENFADVNFGIDDISSIFDGTSSFYKFLTASISILPPYFLLILGAFFVTMLAICVVKWVLK